MIEMKVSYDADKQRALEDTLLGGAGAHPEQKVQTEDPREMERLAREMPIEQAASRWIVSDDPDEQVERIKPYIDLGFTHLVFHAPGLDQVRFIEQYGRDVLPKLRAWRRRGIGSAGACPPPVSIVSGEGQAPALRGDPLARLHAVRDRRGEPVALAVQPPSLGSWKNSSRPNR